VYHYPLMVCVSYEWADRPEVKRLFEVLGYKVQARWEEDFIVYDISLAGGRSGVLLRVRMHGDHLMVARGRLMKTVLGL